MKKTATISALAFAIAALGATATMAQSNADTGAQPVAKLASWFGGHGDGEKDGHGRGGKDGHGGGHRDGKRGGDERGEGRGGKMLRQIEAFDLNKDGSVTQAEIDQFRNDQIAKFDANKDGTLSLDEYQALWLEQMRDRMVDAFQKHDNDGNGQVTTDEFNKRFTGLVERLDRNGDGKLNKDDRGGRRPVAPASDAAPAPAPEAAPAQ